MEFIKPGINLDFVGKRKLAFGLSVCMIVLTIFLVIWRGGPNLGVDFSGGVLVQVKMDRAVPLPQMRAALEVVQLQDSIIQEFGEEGQFEYLIRVRNVDIELTGLGDKVKKALSDEFGEGVEMRRVEMVGPKVGKDLRQKALFAIFYAILFIAIYISGRFELKWLMSIVMALSLALVVYGATSIGMSVTWLILMALAVTIALCWFLKLKYALGAIIALIHDVTITIGAFALTDREISLSIIAAFLTIVGYSLNDTIIVFDRIRENLRRFRRRPFEEVMNKSINETLSRTLLTSTTTLAVVLILFIVGGGVIHDFAFAMLVGIVVGTYSSIFVASPVLLIWEGRFSGAAGKDAVAKT
ncbi:MAG: protein translocase subunit SecF [Deltaproteobacteria bacterium]|nr:protein translocase subunit SecF [Deltaproteobacteria bacterium]